MDIKITKHNGDTFTMESIGVTVKDILVSSPEIITHYEDIEGRHGVIDGAISTLGIRTITVPFYFDADLVDYPIIRDLLLGLFVDTKPFYIEELRRQKMLSYEFVGPNDKPRPLGNTENKLFSGKRYPVRLRNRLDIEQAYRCGEGELMLETVETPFGESVNIINRKYIENTFVFRNQGDVPIDMRTQNETEITFKGVSNNLTIKNLTTNEEWKYNASTTANDEIKLVGVRSLKNGQSIFSETNKKLISFGVGNNKLEVSGASEDFDLTISTRFYFL